MLTLCDSYVPDSDDAVYGSAGYGLQVLYDNFGTLASFMRLDVAVRLLGEPRRCLGETPEGGPAVQLYLSLFQPF